MTDQCASREVPCPARRRGLLLRALLPCALALGLAACGATARPLRPEFDLRSPDPELRTRAVGHCLSVGDVSQVPALISLLDDDDAAVRASAGEALRGLTGHDTGYRPYETREERRRHQESWRAWWAAGGRGGPVGTAPSPPPSGYTGGADVRRP